MTPPEKPLATPDQRRQIASLSSLSLLDEPPKLYRSGSFVDNAVVVKKKFAVNPYTKLMQERIALLRASLKELEGSVIEHPFSDCHEIGNAGPDRIAELKQSFYTLKSMLLRQLKDVLPISSFGLEAGVRTFRVCGLYASALPPLFSPQKHPNEAYDAEIEKANAAYGYALLYLHVYRRISRDDGGSCFDFAISFEGSRSTLVCLDHQTRLYCYWPKMKKEAFKMLSDVVHRCALR